MKKGIEKRGRVRFRIPTLLKYKRIQPSSVYLITNIRDISASGIAFLSDLPVPQDSLLEICFLDPAAEMMKVEGRVVYCRQVTKDPVAFRVGVRFEDISETVMDMLTKAESFFLEQTKK